MAKYKILGRIHLDSTVPFGMKKIKCKACDSDIEFTGEAFTFTSGSFNSSKYFTFNCPKCVQQFYLQETDDFNEFLYCEDDIIIDTDQLDPVYKMTIIESGSSAYTAHVPLTGEALLRYYGLNGAVLVEGGSCNG